MCEFCENIYENGDINGDVSLKYHGMSLVKENGFNICVITKDKFGNDESWTVSQPINYCPICSRKLVKE